MTTVSVAQFIFLFLNHREQKLKDIETALNALYDLQSWNRHQYEFDLKEAMRVLIGDIKLKKRLPV